LKKLLLTSRKRAALLSLLIGSSGCFALGYEELVGAALDRDSELLLLGIAEERALIASSQARASRDTPALGVSTGSLSLASSPEGLSLSAAPAASLSLPGGSAIEASAPLAFGSSGYYAPSLGLSLPIVRRGDERVVAAERAEASYAAARYARSKRRAEVEKAVAEALKAAIQAEADGGTARRKVEVAALALEKAQKLDGAQPGGAAFLSLERERKAAERSLRDAEAAKARGLERLALLSGLDRSAGLIPARLPEAPLASSLPAPESLESARSSDEELRIARLAASEAGRTKGLSLKLGAEYAAGLLPYTLSSSLAPGAELDAGLGYETSGISLSFALGYRPDLGEGSGPGPTASLSLSWKPAPKGSAALEERDRALSVAEAAAKAAASLDSGKSALRDLEYRREDLEASSADVSEDLAAAKEQLALYELWRSRGAVSDSEYREVLAFAAEAESRARLQAVERLIWRIDLEMLGAQAPKEEK
jgi:hypothetical protein